MTIGYGEGRVFYTTLGHRVETLACVGLEALLVRGCERAATGAVTLPLPGDFPDERGG